MTTLSGPSPSRPFFQAFPLAAHISYPPLVSRPFHFPPILFPWPRPLGSLLACVGGLSVPAFSVPDSAFPGPRLDSDKRATAWRAAWGHGQRVAAARTRRQPAAPRRTDAQNENSLGPEGAAKLAPALEKMPGLQMLWLVSWRGRGGDGGREVGRRG